MAFISVEFRSGSLNKATTARVLINEDVKPPYPVFYLLHGLSDNQTEWTRSTSLERYSKRYPFLIVMPDGGRSFYCDSPLGNYESFIVRDLVPLIEKFFPVKKQRGARAIGGLSMGGYGSMKLALKYHKLFGAAACHSSAFSFLNKPEERWAKVKDLNCLCSGVDREANDVYALAAKVKKSELPKLYFDCGTSDFLYQENIRFHKHLAKLRVPHTFRTFPGEHNWAYWDAHIQDALAFLAKAITRRG